MAGISVKLPLSVNDADGHYTLNKTFMEVTKQNFKNLILTIPGERIMNPDFGVGIAQYLFEQDVEETREMITAKIHEQVQIYMPHVIIQEISFSSVEQSREIGSHVLSVAITYAVTPLNETDILDIKIG